MKTLVYGAGNIGRLYAARLKDAGHDVTILARGQRLQEIREVGIRLEDFKTGQRTTIHVDAIERLRPDDIYDLILVVLPKNCLSEVVPILSENETPNVMFFGNSAAGPDELMQGLGGRRVLLGFPGAAAIEQNDYLRYVILDSKEQPTTIGEVDGSESKRIDQIAHALRTAGFPVSTCDRMDAWLKTHAAEIVPTAFALYMAGNDLDELRRSRETMTLMVQAIREGYRILMTLGIPLTPSNRRVLRWIPEQLLVTLMKLKFSNKAMPIKVGHASNARAEMQIVATELKQLADRAGIATPALDALQEQANLVNDKQTWSASA